MSDQQLERLNTLLQRVQANRRVARVREATRAQSPANAQVLQPMAAGSVAQALPEPARSRRSTPPLAPNAPVSNDAMGAAIPAEAPPPPGRRPAAPARPSPLEAAFAGELERESPSAALRDARREPAPSMDARREPAPSTDARREPAPSTDARREPAPSMDARREPAPSMDARREPAPSTDARREPARPADPRREPAPQPRSQRPPPPAQPVAAPFMPPTPQEIVPLVIEPDLPRASARPIAQVVSKHAPALDATFGAMLKRSLSLRPH